MSNRSDSGMIDELTGNITNLCRQRVGVNVRQGVVTETSPYLPVSLGLSMDESDGVWEEVLDEEGQPTGIERMSFR